MKEGSLSPTQLNLLTCLLISFLVFCYFFFVLFVEEVFELEASEFHEAFHVNPEGCDHEGHTGDGDYDVGEPSEFSEFFVVGHHVNFGVGCDNHSCEEVIHHCAENEGCDHDPGTLAKEWCDFIAVVVLVDFFFDEGCVEKLRIVEQGF